MGDKKSKTRIRLVLIFGLFLATFVLINAQEFIIAAVIYIVIGLMSLVFYREWGKIGKFSDLEGIDNNFIKDGLVGLGLGIITIFVGNIFSFIGAIGIPQVQSIAGVIGRFIIIVPVAAIFEEVFFRDFLLDFLENKLGLPKLPSGIIAAFGFSFFHLLAYGEQLAAASGSFFSAAFMGFIFGLVSERQNSLAGSIFYHMSLNTYIGFITLSVIIT